MSILVNCDNGDDALDHNGDVRECSSCGGTFCQPCREAVSGSKTRCPLCNSYVGDDQSCRLVGGCGK
jgi:hypothetical protein